MQRQRRQAFPFHSRTHVSPRHLLHIIDRAPASLFVFHFIVKSERTALHLHWKGRNAISFAAGRHFEKRGGSATFVDRLLEESFPEATSYAASTKFSAG